MLLSGGDFLVIINDNIFVDNGEILRLILCNIAIIFFKNIMDSKDDIQ